MVTSVGFLENDGSGGHESISIKFLEGETTSLSCGIRLNNEAKGNCDVVDDEFEQK